MATIHMTLAARCPAPLFVARPRGIPQHALSPPSSKAKAFWGGSMTRLMQKCAEPGAELSLGVPTCIRANASLSVGLQAASDTFCASNSLVGLNVTLLIHGGEGNSVM